MSRFAIALGLVAAPLVKADLPVHCLRHQIAGEWEFTLGPLSSQRSSCGHRHPDNQDNEPALHQTYAGDASQESKLRVQLNSPDRASTNMDPSGTFTMIYDEGFEVAVEGKTFFAFSRYDMVDDNGSGGFGADKHNVTHCGETLTGWYRDAHSNQFGCYWGRKSDFVEEAPAMKDRKNAMMLKIDQQREDNEMSAAMFGTLDSSNQVEAEAQQQVQQQDSSSIDAASKAADATVSDDFE